MRPHPSFILQGGQLFSPALLIGAVAVYQDPENYTTLTGATVDAWNGVIGPAMTSGAGPSYSLGGWNGVRPGVVFSAQDMSATLGSAIGASPTLFAVVKLTATVAGKGSMFVSAGLTSILYDLFSGSGWSCSTFGGGTPERAYTGTGNLNVNAVIFGWTDGSHHFSALFSGAGSTATSNAANPQAASTGTDIYLSTPTGSTGAQSSFTGNMVAAGFINRNLTLGERQKVEGWAAWRYGGITLYPAHPYFSSPPLASAEEMERALDLGLYERRPSGLIAPRRPALRARRFTPGFRLAA